MVCFNESRTLMSFLHMHLITNQSSKAPQRPGLEPEKGRHFFFFLNVSIVSVINEIIFIQQTVLANVYSVNESIWAAPFRSHIQTTTS